MDALPLAPLLLGVVGVLLLMLGRRIYWFFVAAVGFFGGYVLGGQLFPDMGDPLLILVSLAIGVVGAFLARLLQRLAVVGAGAIVGAVISSRLAAELGLHTPAGVLVACVTGAVLMAVFVAVVFDPALIVMSSLAGSVMIVQALNPDSDLIFPAVVALSALGIGFQFWIMRRRGEPDAG